MYNHKVSYIAKSYFLFAFFSLVNLASNAQQSDFIAVDDDVYVKNLSSVDPDFDGTIHLFSDVDVVYDVSYRNLTVENGTLIIAGEKRVEGNLTVSENGAIVFADGAQLTVGGNVCIMSDLSLKNGSQISFGGDITLGGDVFIDATSSISATNSVYTTYFSGDRDVTYSVESPLILVNVVVDKQGKSVLSVAEGSSLILNGNLTGKNGYLKGSVRFKEGPAQSYIEAFDDCLKDVDVRIDVHLKSSEPSLITTHPLRIKSLYSSFLEYLYVGKNELTVSEGMKSMNFARVVVDGFSADGGVIMPITEGNRMNLSCFADGVALRDGIYKLEGTKLESSFIVDFTDADNYVKFVLNNGNHYYTTTNELQKSDRSYYKVSTLRNCAVDPTSATYTILPFNKKDEFKPAVYLDREWFVDEDAPQKASVQFKGHTVGDFACLVIENIERRKYVTAAKGTWDSKIWRLDGDDANAPLHNGSDITVFDDVTIKSGHSISSTSFYKANKFIYFKPVHIDIEENAKLIIKHDDLMLDLVNMYATSVEGDGVLEYYNHTIFNVNGTWTKYWDVSKFMKNEKSLFVYVNELTNNPLVTRFYTTPFIGNIDMTGKAFQIGEVNINTFQGNVNIKTNVEFTAGHVALAKDLIVDKGNVLTISGDCILEVKGNVINNGTLICKDGATLRICGDLLNSGTAKVDGVLSFSGNRNSSVIGSGSLTVNTVELVKSNVRYGTDIESRIDNTSFIARLNCGFLHLKNGSADASIVHLSDNERGMLWLSNPLTDIKSASVKGSLKIDNGAVAYMDNLKPRVEWVMEMPSVKITDNAKLVIRDSFDMRGGALDMGEGAQMDILGNGPVRFSAVMGECNESSMINIIGGSSVSIATDTPFGNLHIGENTEVSITSNSLMLKGGLRVDEGSVLDATDKNNRVRISGDINISGDYLCRENVTELNGVSQKIKIASGELYSLTCKGKNVLLNDDLIVGGDLSVCNGSFVSGNSLIIAGASPQKCMIEGTVDVLEIDNVMGVNASEFHNGVMTIAGKLQLSNGVLDIGSNILSILPNATIEGSGKVRLSPSSAESGIRVNVNAEVEKSIVLPISSDFGYMPVSIRDIVSSSTGSITFSVYNDLWLLSSDGVNAREGNFSCSIAPSAFAGSQLYPLFKAKGKNWIKSDGDVKMVNRMLCADFRLSGSVDGQYRIGKKTESPGVLTFETRRKIECLSFFDGDDWIVTDTNGAEVDITAVGGFDGGILKVRHDVRFDSEMMSNVHLEAVDVEKGVVLDFDRSHDNVINYVSGSGTIRVCSSSALPKGDYNLFFCEQQGSINYAGTDYYCISPVVPRMNNVIVSGEGMKCFANSSVVITGSLTVDGAGLIVDSGADIQLKGDLSVLSGSIEGNGILTMSGDRRQIISATADVVRISGLSIDNRVGVSSNVNVDTDRLKLERGVLDMSDKWLRVAEQMTSSDDFSYVSGILIRYIKANEQSLFPIGDRGMPGHMCICGQTDGWWQAQYHNESHPESAFFTGEAFWEILPVSHVPDRCSVSFSYDEVGAFASHIVYLENNQWHRVNLSSKSGCKDRGYLFSDPINVKPIDGNPVVFALENRNTDNTCVWTGVSDNNWYNPVNWQDGVVPDITTNVTIPYLTNDRYPIISHYGAESRNIRIMQGARLSVKGSNASLSVKNNIINKGSFDLYYMYTQIPQFRYGGEIVGNKLCIYRTFLRNRGYYIGSATAEGSFDNLINLNDDNGDVLRQFDTTSRSFYDVDCLYGGSMAEKAGSFLLDKSCHTNDNYVIQSGTPVRDGVQLTGPMSRGWHWLANPYPFTVNIKDYIRVIDGAINPTVYARGYKSENGIGGYLFYTYNMEENLSAAGNESEKMETLAPFEGFAVYCEKDGTVLLLEQNIEPTGTKQPKLKSASVGQDGNVLRLSVGNGFRKDELVLVFKEGGSMSRHHADSYKYASQPRSSFEIFTAKDKQKMTIALFPAIDRLPDDEVNFSVMPTNGDASSPIISVSGVENVNEDYNVLLVDRLTGCIVDLRTTDKYEICEVDNLYPDRFALRFEYRDNTKPNEEKAGAAPTTISRTTTEKAASVKKVRYDISGRRVGKHHRGVSIISVQAQ